MKLGHAQAIVPDAVQVKAYPVLCCLVESARIVTATEPATVIMWGCWAKAQTQTAHSTHAQGSAALGWDWLCLMHTAR